MDIMELGAIGELVGGLAVIASLIFVGLQVRQSNAVARDMSVRSIANEVGQIFLKTCDPQLVQVVRRAIRDFDGLTNNEKSVASGFLAALFVSAQTTFAVRSSPRPSRMERITASWIASPGLQSWWTASKETYSAPFVNQIEKLAREGMAPIEEVWPWFALDDSEKGGA
ncbi:MAG: hypothetical protein HKP27_09490 [Myxococcales bacterium]|nr:hypothetical protein [Myxococcales bacterium]